MLPAVEFAVHITNYSIVCRQYFHTGFTVYIDFTMYFENITYTIYICVCIWLYSSSYSLLGSTQYETILRPFMVQCLVD